MNVRQSAASSGPVGIGGWLILPIIGFAGVAGKTMLQYAWTDWAETWQFFQMQEEPVVVLKVPTLISLMSWGLVIATALVALYLIYLKRRRAIVIALVHYCMLIAAALFDVWLDFLATQSAPDLAPDGRALGTAVKALVFAGLGIPYFLASKRVRNTFVEPLRPVAPPRRTRFLEPRS